MDLKKKQQKENNKKKNNKKQKTKKQQQQNTHGGVEFHTNSSFFNFETLSRIEDGIVTSMLWVKIFFSLVEMQLDGGCSHVTQNIIRHTSVIQIAVIIFFLRFMVHHYNNNNNYYYYF